MICNSPHPENQRAERDRHSAASMGRCNKLRSHGKLTLPGASESADDDLTVVCTCMSTEYQWDLPVSKNQASAPPRSTVLLTVGRVGEGLIVTVTGGTEDLEVELVLLEVAWEWRMPAIWVAIMPAASVELAELEVEELLVLLEEELDDRL